MTSFWRIFSLEWTALVRSKTLILLVLAAIAWMCAVPFVVTGDGTPSGLREVAIRYALGGVFALVVVAMLSSATGSLARERAEKRLQLTLVRPVRPSVIVLGKLLAHLAVGAIVLAVSAGALAVDVAVRDPAGLAARCNHVVRPVLPSPREEAKAMYAAYMADTNTALEVRQARKSIVLRILENRARDHYQTLPTNAVTRWRFKLPDSEGALAVRLRFTNQLEMRQDVRGIFRFGARTAKVDNFTQAVLTVPLAGNAELPDEGVLEFENLGTQPLMLRPRQDLELLVPADEFVWNLLRAWVVMLAVLSIVVSFGLFLSASLGRPVALFTAIVMLIVGEISPSVVEQYPDELETNPIDRIGLVIARSAASVAKPVSALSPLESLSRETCLEWRDVCSAIGLGFLAVPIFLALLSGFVLPRKQDGI